jgi:hypothetical protein
VAQAVDPADRRIRPGGFTVDVRVGEDPNCPVVRADTATIEGRIQEVEAKLELRVDLTAGERAALLASLQTENTTLQGSQLTSRPVCCAIVSSACLSLVR